MNHDEKRDVANTPYIKVELKEEPTEPVEFIHANCPCCRAKFPWGLKQETKKDESC